MQLDRYPIFSNLLARAASTGSCMAQELSRIYQLPSQEIVRKLLFRKNLRQII